MGERHFSGWLSTRPHCARGPITRCDLCHAVRLVPRGCSCPGNVARRPEDMRQWDMKARAKAIVAKHRDVLAALKDR